MGPALVPGIYSVLIFLPARDNKLELIGFDHFYTVGGCFFPKELENMVEERTAQHYPGKIEFDDLVNDTVIAGVSLLELPRDSPGYLSVRRLMEKAGYK